ncbi:hypothetical protein [Streptomyces sp. AN091965]|uniref:hypothetical protein n=1 Tax=Streptomyces sp. AN091965 TaxID=2927803 RepID=UPI001F603B13|nr:hypothetical protein [Streptomyces sp. AN091965]MCI3933912.1 hypothetical protein [Streptomyces sp. AN091965]
MTGRDGLPYGYEAVLRAPAPPGTRGRTTAARTRTGPAPPQGAVRAPVHTVAERLVAERLSAERL